MENRGVAPGGFGPADQRLVHQRGQPLEGVHAERLRVAHGFGRLERPAPGEHRQPGEQPSPGGVEQVVAPGDGVAEGPLAFWEGPGPGGEDGEALLEPGQHLLGRQDLGPGCCQLDGQRQAVQPGGDLGHGRGVLFGQPEAWPYRQSPLGEQPDGFEPAQGVEVRESFGIGQIQRRHHILLLAPERQHHAGGGHHLYRRGRGEELLDHRAGVHDLFEVVDDQEELPVTEVVLHGPQDGAPGDLLDPEDPGQDRGDQGRIGHRRQVHEEGAVAELRQQLGGDLEGQSGLPGAPRPGEGEEPGPVQQPPDLGQLLLPAHERGELQGKVVRPGVERPGRREVGRKPLDHEVVEVLGEGEVLQPVRPEVPEERPFRKGVLDQSPGGVRDDDLPAVGRPGDPGRPVHVDADIVVPAQHPFTGVQPHPDSQGEPWGPVVGGQASLGGHRGPDRRHRA
jgi:hypothetical protein